LLHSELRESLGQQKKGGIEGGKRKKRRKTRVRKMKKRK
jgi:hypothetical protein